MCEHLQPLADYLKERSVPVTWRGQPWTQNCREWVYYDCVLEPQSLKTKLGLESFIQVHDYVDIKAGSELGLFCDECKDAIIGIHPTSPSAKGKAKLG